MTKKVCYSVLFATFFLFFEMTAMSVRDMNMAADSLELYPTDVKEWLLVLNQQTAETDSSQLADIYFLLGKVSLRIEKYVDAETYFSQALHYNRNPEQSIRIHINIAKSFQSRNLLSDAIIHAQAALEIASQGFSNMELPVYLMFFNIHRKNRDKERKVEYLEKAEQALIYSHNEIDKADYYLNKARSDLFKNDHRLETYSYLDNCKQIYSKYNHLKKLATVHTSIATRYILDSALPDYKDKAYQKAEYHYKKSLSIHKQLGRTKSLAIQHNNLANLYAEQNKDNLALVEGLKAASYADSTKNWAVIRDIHFNLISLHAYAKKDGAPITYLQKYEAARDSLEQREKQEILLDLQEKYDTQAKEQQISQQKGQLFLLLGATTLFFLLTIALVYFFINLRKANKKTKEQSEELRVLDKVKSNFFANISHELRTPLTLILGPLSYILDNPEDWKKEEVKNQLLVMQRNGKSLMQLIEEILDLSKLEANKLDLIEEVTPIQEFFEYVSSSFEPQFKSQHLNYELILNLENKNLNVLLDRKKMEKVLNNFLSNAIKFTPRGGKITMEIQETDQLLKIKVSDTGKGVYPNDLPRIFDRFYQSEQAEQKLYGGTGIGLALVSEFASLMKGRVYAKSLLGKGSDFYFEFPKKVVEATTVLSQVRNDIFEEEQIDSIGTDFTILVVEDNYDMREFVCQLLRKQYTEVISANNGLEGLKALRERGSSGVHLIISDVMMPEMDGFNMLKEIKSSTEWNGIPVVMLTALAAERDKLAALTIGVDDYLTKPFSVTELLIRVQNLLFNYHQRLIWQKTEAVRAEGLGNDERVSTTPNPISLSPTDKAWIEEMEKFIKELMSREMPDVDKLAASVFLGKRQLTRRMKATIGLTPARFIREVQLQSARKELEKGTAISVMEVAFNHGFTQHSTFSTLFKKRFGKSPSEYLR